MCALGVHHLIQETMSKNPGRAREIFLPTFYNERVQIFNVWMRIGKWLKQAPPGGGSPSGRGLGVGEAVPPRHAQARKSPASRRGFLARRLTQDIANRANLGVQIVLTDRNLFLKVGHPRVDSGLHCVHALLKPLETASDGNGCVVAVLVDDALDQFEVFLFQ